MSADSPLSWLRKVGGGSPDAMPPAPEPAPAAAPAPSPVVSIEPTQSRASSATGATATPDGYRAWGSDHADSLFLDVRRKPDIGSEEAGDILPLTYLLRVTYTGGAMGDLVTLLFSECAVSVTGAHLKGLRRELMAGKVHFLEEYDSARYPTRPGSGVPIILGVRILEPGEAPIGARRSSGRKKPEA